MLDERFEIVFNDPVAEGTFLMGLNAPEIVSEASPGQFVMMRVGSVMDPLLRRPFSICGTLEGHILLILYKVIGKGTAIMSESEKGTFMTVLGPLGKGFVPPPVERRAILAAGGIGIAPLIFLAQRLTLNGTIFFAGYRHAGEVVPFDKVGLGEDTLELATDDGSTGHQGLITELLEKRLLRERPDSAEIYACGPEPMLKRVALLAHDNHFACQMSLEAYMACGLGACQGCAVKTAALEKPAYHLICRDGPVLPYDSIDWEL